MLSFKWIKFTLFILKSIFKFILAKVHWTLMTDIINGIKHSNNAEIYLNKVVDVILLLCIYYP